MNDLSWIFWITGCSFSISTCCFPWHFDVTRRLLSLNLFSQRLSASDFSSAASSPLSAFTELKSVRTLLWMRLWLKGTLGCSDLLSRPSNFLHTSNKAVLLSYHSCLHRSSTFNFLQGLSFAFTPWQTVWYKRPSFRPVSALDMPFSPSFVISSF